MDLNLSARLRLQNVLLTSDFSEASFAAVAYAATIAGHYGGKIYALHVIPPEAYGYVAPDEIPKVEESVRAWTEQQMTSLVECEQFKAVPHEGVIKHGEVWDAVAVIIEQRKMDVIVTGTRGRRGLKKLMLGSIAEEIFRSSPVPVLTVPPSAGQAGPNGLRTILYPTDFSADSVSALAYALSLAQEFQARLICLHVIAEAGDDSRRDQLTEFFTQRLRELIPADATPWLQQQSIIEFAPPAEAILKAAHDYKADLIVMSVRGAGSLVRASTHFGSTAYAVVSEAESPVLTVRKLQPEIVR